MNEVNDHSDSEFYYPDDLSDTELLQQPTCIESGEKKSKLLGDIEDITCPRVDTNFIFECSTRYLMSERSERVRYRVEHEDKIRIHKRACNILFIIQTPMKYQGNDFLD